MKKYLILFISIFCTSVLLSSFSVLISSNNKKPYSPNSISISEEKNNTITDFTAPIDIETVENKIVKDPPSFSMPVKSNEIGMKFSNEQLIYSKTLDEWIIHTGIDIIVPIGSPVYASEKGTITEVSNNVGDGIKIVIEHEDGYKTIYSNLSTTKMVHEGEIVDKGQVISGTGKTSTFEYNEKDHLHFEIFKDGTPINPINLIESN